MTLFYIVSYNEPKIEINAIWDGNGSTLADQYVIGGLPRAIFINIENTIYVASHSKSEILIWSEESLTPTQIKIPQLFLYTSLFITVSEDIYFASGDEKGQIDKWPKSSNRSVFVTKFVGDCFDLFIDVYNVLYCSMRDEHRVDKVSLINGNNTPVMIVGTGSFGSAAYELNAPRGIFVDTYFNLYVADGLNNRILLFPAGQTVGVVVAELGTPINLYLDHPVDVILDGNDFLYIVDNNNHRIIRSTADQWQCIIGCTNKMGLGSDELHKPYAIQLDSHGNLYIADEFNHRIQKFTLTNISTRKYDQE